MKKKIVYLFIFIVAVLVQTAIVPVLVKTKLIPDIVLMSILAWSIIDGFESFLSWTVVLGIIYDLLTYSQVGEHVLIFVAVVYFVSFFSRRISFEFQGIGLVLFLLFVLVVSLGSDIVSTFMAVGSGEIFLDFWKSAGIIKALFWQLAGNIFLFFFCFLFIQKTKQFFALEYQK